MSVSTATREPGLPRTTQAEGAALPLGCRMPHSTKALSWATGLSQRTLPLAPDTAATKVQGQEKPGGRAAAGCSVTPGLGPEPQGSDREGAMWACPGLPPAASPNPEQARGPLLLLQGVLSFGIKTKRTFISTGEAGIAAAAVGIFIKKENILDLVLVHVFCGQKVIGDWKGNTSHVPRPGLACPALCHGTGAGCGCAWREAGQCRLRGLATPCPPEGAPGAKDTWAAPCIRAEARPNQPGIWSPCSQGLPFLHSRIQTTNYML